MNSGNYIFVEGMIKGISKSVNAIQYDKFHILKPRQDFKVSNQFELFVSTTGADYNKIEFKDYCPYVFEGIRRMYGISSTSFLNSIGVKSYCNKFYI